MENKESFMSQLREALEETEQQIDTYRNKKTVKRQNKASKRNLWRNLWKNH